MQELKFMGKSGDSGKSACDCMGDSPVAEVQKDGDACCCSPQKDVPAWVVGKVATAVGPACKVSTELTSLDLWEHIKCRATAFRNHYIVDPGLYAVGEPGKDADVLISANYKYSFDMLRRELKGLNAWILVLDTKGINVWCAAGKGTFGTEELVGRISSVRLDKVVAHRQVIVPQLGAPGVGAFKVKRAAGFRVLYGPVRAKDIPAYIRAGYEATKEMRRVKFSAADRLVLTPMEINPAMKKYPLFAAIILAVFGLTPSGILFRDAFAGGLPFLILGLISVAAGAFLTPVLLPFIPSRSFAVKGWLVGLVSVFLATNSVQMFNQHNALLLAATYLFFPLASSYLALQFTGSTTFTGMSGVKKELKVSVPVYILACAAAAALLIIYKLTEWRII